MVQLFKGQWGKRLQAILLRNAVEGQQTAGSISIEGGKPHFLSLPTLKDTESDMRTLAQFLRTNEPISADIRHWLADLCDPDGESSMKLTIQKRRSGRPQATMLQHLAAVECFIDHQAEHGFDYALARAKEDFGLRRTTVIKAVRALRPAIEEIRRLNRDGQ